MALIKSRKINDPTLKLGVDPTPDMLVTVTNKTTGKTKTTELQNAVKYSGISLSSGIIGQANKDTVPDDSTNKFLKYSIPNDDEHLGVYANFLDAEGEPLVVIADDTVNDVVGDLSQGIVEFWGQNNIWKKNITKIPVNGFAQSGGSDKTVKQLDEEKLGVLNGVGKDGTNINEALSNVGVFNESNNNKLFIVDEEGNVIFSVDANGPNFPGIVTQAQIAVLKNILSNDDGFYITDGDGYIAFQVTNEGVKSVGQNSGPGSVIYKVGVFIADILQIIVYGQSLSVAGSMAQAIDLYDSLTFQGGILTDYDPTVAGEADTYFGSGFKALPKTGTETEGKGFVRAFKDLIKTENGIDYPLQETTMVTNAPGTGGISYAGLADKDGIYYTRLLESVRHGKDFALSQGKTYNVPALCYIQGENSQDKIKTAEQWYSDLWALFQNLNADIKAITGQENDVQFINYQIASFGRNTVSGIQGIVDPSLGVLQLCLDKDNVHYGTAMYQYQYADSLHLQSWGYRVMGALMGIIAKRKIIDGVKAMPIYPLNWSISQNTAGTEWLINLKMSVPVKPLVFDESINSYFDTAPSNFGFSIKNGAGDEIIQSISIRRGDTLNILCSEDPTGLEMTYAIQGAVSGGNLRDSQGDAMTINCDGLTKRLDNWAPIFKKII